jgi:hypothetical protein
MVRDVFHVLGYLVIDHTGQISQIILNQADPLASGLVAGLRALLASEQVAVTLGET